MRYYIGRVGSVQEVTQRLKRFGTIVHKLEREPTMALTSMEDIGGVRAILPSQQHVLEVRERLDKQDRWSIRRRRFYIDGGRPGPKVAASWNGCVSRNASGDGLAALADVAGADEAAQTARAGAAVCPRVCRASRMVDVATRAVCASRAVARISCRACARASDRAGLDAMRDDH